MKMKMKTITTLLFAICSIGAIGQRKTIRQAEEKIGSISCNYNLSIDMDKADTTRYIYMSFQNMKYNSITDLHSIFIVASDTLVRAEFISDLKKALPEMEIKQSISWSRSKYTLNLYDFAKGSLYCSSSKGGYTTLKSEQVEKLIAWLEGLPVN
jgi:hypothetical protein